MKRRQVKPLAASLLDALDYDSSDDSDFEVGDASGTHDCVSTRRLDSRSFEPAGVLLVSSSLPHVVV